MEFSIFTKTDFENNAKDVNKSCAKSGVKVGGKVAQRVRLMEMLGVIRNSFTTVLLLEVLMVRSIVGRRAMSIAILKISTVMVTRVLECFE